MYHKNLTTVQVVEFERVGAHVVQLPLRAVVVLLKRLVPRQRLLAARAVQNILTTNNKSIELFLLLKIIEHHGASCPENIRLCELVR